MNEITDLLLALEGREAADEMLTPSVPLGDAYEIHVARDNTPPCDGCEHESRCLFEHLSCCAFAAFVGRSSERDSVRDVRLQARWTHRKPSRAWWVALENSKPPPVCRECR